MATKRAPRNTDDNTPTPAVAEDFDAAADAERRANDQTVDWDKYPNKYV